jgi:hypothetical protein
MKTGSCSQFYSHFSFRLALLVGPVLLVGFATQGFAQPPSPPSNLRIEGLPSTERLNNAFARQGIPVEVRSLILSLLRELPNSDLAALANGFEPSELGVAKPEVITPSQWRQLVPSYAESLLADREARWNVIWQIVFLTVAAFFSVLGGMWIERRKTGPRG